MVDDGDDDNDDDLSGFLLGLATSQGKLYVVLGS